MNRCLLRQVMIISDIVVSWKPPITKKQQKQPLPPPTPQKKSAINDTKCPICTGTRIKDIDHTVLVCSLKKIGKQHVNINLL